MTNIRQLEKKDAGAIIELFKQLTERQIELDIDALLADKAVSCMVLEDDGVVAGCASLMTYYLPTKGKIGTIEDVVVDEKFRGRGFGKMLMEKLVQIAKENNLKKIQLTSSPKREAARALYSSMGFEMKDTNVFVLNL